MNKKSKIAIDLFKIQADKINSLKIESRHEFANTLKDYIKLYIDPNSEHLNSFGTYNIFWSVENFNKDKNRVNDIINDCVQTISANGIYKPHDNKQNFLGHFDNNTLWTIISFCVVALTTGSFYIGKYHERSELLINHISTNSNSISTSDTTSNPKNNNIRQDIKDNYIDSITKDK
jgi:hypothetical protein